MFTPKYDVCIWIHLNISIHPSSFSSFLLPEAALFNTYLDAWLYAIFLKTSTNKTSISACLHFHIFSRILHWSIVSKANVMIMKSTWQLAFRKIRTTIASQHSERSIIIIAGCSFLTSHGSWSVSHPSEQLALQYRLHYYSTLPGAVFSSYELHS